MKILSNTEAELKKSPAYKKGVHFISLEIHSKSLEITHDHELNWPTENSLTYDTFIMDYVQKRI